MLFGVVRKLAADGVGVDLHLASPGRDPADRRSRHGALRRAHGGHRPAGRHAARRAGREDGRPQGRAAVPGRARGTSDEVVLDVRGVSGRPRVKECSFQVRAGEVLGIGGLVGAGRSELLRLIYGLDKPDTGEVLPRRQAAAGRAPGRRDRRAAWAWLRRTASRRACCSAGAWPRTSASPTSGASRTAGCISLQGRAPRAGDKLRELNTVPGRSGPDHARAVRRQPAEGRARALAAARVPRPAARRADARRRRRRQGRDLPPDRRARGGGHRASSWSPPRWRS